MKFKDYFKENMSNLILYRGNSVHNKNGNYYSVDKEWARQFTQSGRDEEISTLNVNKEDILIMKPLPRATNEEDISQGIKLASEKGFKGFMVDEGKGQPNSVFMVNKLEEMMVKRFDLDSRVDNTPMVYEDDVKYHGKVLEVSWINPKLIKRRDSNEVSSVPDDVASNMDFSEPIDVSIFSDGELICNNGHHRLAAAKQRNMPYIRVGLTSINARGNYINQLIKDQEGFRGGE